MSAWSTAVADLRLELSDGPTDKLQTQKPLIGNKDGANKIFKTFEFRRLTPFKNAVSPFGVFINDTHVNVANEDLESGFTTLLSPPNEGARVTGTYYSQWFNDTQLGLFLKNATQFLGLGSNPSKIPDSLQPAAIKYACADAYQELSVRWARALSDGYRVEDSKEKQDSPVVTYLKLSDAFRKQAEALRKGNYTRQNQGDAPLFSTISGRQRTVEPNR